MKKIIGLIMIIILFTVNGQNVIAVETDRRYTPKQMQTIITRYQDNENLLNNCLTEDTGLAYWKLINNIKKDKILSWSLDQSSKLIDEYPDKKKYAEVLGTLMAMQTGEIGEQVSTQSQFDDLKEWDDLGWDAVKIGNSIVGATEILNAVTTITDVVYDGTDIVIKTKEEAKYYEAVLQDYSQSYEFLDAIINYSQNEDLKDVARKLKKANNELLEVRLEYLTGTSEKLIKYEFDFFYKNLFWNILKEIDSYKNDELIQFFVNKTEKIAKKLLSTKSKMKLAFDITMIMGNAMFGTNNTYSRYQEMKIVADISEALVKANKKIKISEEINEENLKALHRKCYFYKTLTINHARGEYLMHSLLAQDGTNEVGVVNLLWVKEHFSKKEMKIDEWYNSQIQVLEKCNKYIDWIFDGNDLQKNNTKKENNDSKKTVYLWAVEPTIEADDIYYMADYPDAEHSINELSKQADNPNAVIRRGDKLGIIDLDGQLLTEVEYTEIANFGSQYMLIKENQNYDEYNLWWLDENGTIIDTEGVGNGDMNLTVYYYYGGARQRTGNTSAEFVQDAIPVQQATEYVGMSDSVKAWNSLTGKYALEKDCNLITDFIYDECGSISDGLCAVCQNGKCGYIDEKGQMVIPIEYDASWEEYPVFALGSKRSSSNVKDYCYGASDGYVVLCQDKNWELCDTSGQVIIPSGELEEIRPVFKGKCWAKKNGKWGILEVE